jgi:hypothetical protein
VLQPRAIVLRTSWYCSVYMLDPVLTLERFIICYYSCNESKAVSSRIAGALRRSGPALERHRAEAAAGILGPVAGWQRPPGWAGPLWVILLVQLNL